MPKSSRKPDEFRPKTTRDHWWPRSIQQLWVDEGGWLRRLDFNGLELPDFKPHRKKSKPGSRHRGHEVYYPSSPWSHSFEADFSEIEKHGAQRLKALVSEIGKVKNLPGLSNRRLFSQPHPGSITVGKTLELEGDAINEFLVWAVSLLMRTPGFQSRFLPENWERQPGDPDPGVLNLRNLFQCFKGFRIEESRGVQILFLRSDRKEFYYSDGFYDDVLGWGNSMPAKKPSEKELRVTVGTFFLPLTPSVSVIIRFGLHDRRPVRVSDVSDGVVDILNATTAHYGRKELFYRSQKPSKNVASFLKDKHSSIPISASPTPCLIMDMEFGPERSRKEVFERLITPGMIRDAFVHDGQ